MEEWKPIHDFPGYSVSNHGNVRSDRSGRLLVITQNQYGLAVVGLMRDGKQHQRSVPLLVAHAFLFRPFGPFDTPINVDGDRHNNHVDNLMWRPRWFAVLYNRQFRIPYHNPIDSEIYDIDSGAVYENSFDAAIRNGLLERDVVLSILNHTITWPTHQRFQMVD